MQASTDIEWKKPIDFTPAFAHSVTEIVNGFVTRAVADAVTEKGLNPAEIQTEGVAHALSEAAGSKGDFAAAHQFEVLASSIGDIARVAWTVTLKSGEVLHNLTEAELCNLPNAHDEIIKDVSVQNSSTDYLIKLKFPPDTAFGPCVNGQLRGPHQIVRTVKSEIIQRLASVTPPWWRARDYTLMPILALMAFAGSLASILFGGLFWFGPSLKKSDLNVFLFVLGLVAFILMAVRVPEFWIRVFPRVEFTFGGGETQTRTRAFWRRVLLIGGPMWLFSSVVIPIILIRTIPTLPAASDQAVKAGTIYGASPKTEKVSPDLSGKDQ